MKKRTSKRLLLSTERVQPLQPSKLGELGGAGKPAPCDLSGEHDTICWTSKTPVGGG